MQDTGLMIERKPQSYKDLEVYSLAKEPSVKVHKMTLEYLPKFEMYEEGSQIRRSSKSIVSNIIEGFGRRSYKIPSCIINRVSCILNHASCSCHG